MFGRRQALRVDSCPPMILSLSMWFPRRMRGPLDKSHPHEQLSQIYCNSQVQFPMLGQKIIILAMERRNALHYIVGTTLFIGSYGLPLRGVQVL